MDLTTTLVALEQGGGSEANLIMGGFGTAELIAYKIIVPLLVVVLLLRFKRLHLLRWLCLGIGVVVIWNLVWVV